MEDCRLAPKTLTLVVIPGSRAMRLGPSAALRPSRTFGVNPVEGTYGEVEGYSGNRCDHPTQETGAPTVRIGSFHPGLHDQSPDAKTNGSYVSCTSSYPDHVGWLAIVERSTVIRR